MACAARRLILAIDLATGEVVATGNLRHVIVPGAGPVYAEAGRYVLSP